MFHFLVSGNNRAWMTYLRVGVEVVAVLSWFAGWIAVAVNIGTGDGACEEGWGSCGALKAATGFGAVEWVLFMGTAGMGVGEIWGKRGVRS